MNIGRRNRSAPSREMLAEVRNVVARETSGYRSGGLRIDWHKLDDDAQGRVVELVKEAGAGGGWTWNRLSDRKRRELEGLIERGSDARGVFQDARSMAEIQRLASEAHVAAVRRPLSRRQENGVFQEMSRCIESGWLNVADLAVLSAFITTFVSGRPLGPRTRVERVGDDTVLVIDANMGPFGGSFDPEEQIGPRVQQNLASLELNEWLTVQRSGKQWTVAPGRRLVAAMAGKPIRDEVVVAR